jgi:hypothetical protein
MPWCVYLNLAVRKLLLPALLDAAGQPLLNVSHTETDMAANAAHRQRIGMAHLAALASHFIHRLARHLQEECQVING